MGRLSPNNHGAIPLIFTFFPLSPLSFFVPSPFLPSLFSTCTLPPFVYPPYQYCYDTATCDLTCACLISSRRLLIYIQSKNSKMLTSGRQQVCKHRPRSMNAAFAQGSGERKSPSGVQGQRRGRVWGQSTSLEKAPENRCTLHTQSHSITRFRLHTEQLRYNALCSASFI